MNVQVQRSVGRLARRKIEKSGLHVRSELWTLYIYMFYGRLRKSKKKKKERNNAKSIFKYTVIKIIKFSSDFGCFANLFYFIQCIVNNNNNDNIV